MIKCILAGFPISTYAKPHAYGILHNATKVHVVRARDRHVHVYRYVCIHVYYVVAIDSPGMTITLNGNLVILAVQPGFWVPIVSL